TGWSQQQARHWRFGLGGNPTRKETLVELSTGTGTVLRRVSVPVASAANSRRTPMLSGLPVLTAATRAPRTACAALLHRLFHAPLIDDLWHDACERALADEFAAGRRS